MRNWVPRRSVTLGICAAPHLTLLCIAVDLRNNYSNKMDLTALVFCAWPSPVPQISPVLLFYHLFRWMGSLPLPSANGAMIAEPFCPAHRYHLSVTSSKAIRTHYCHFYVLRWQSTCKSWQQIDINSEECRISTEQHTLPLLWHQASRRRLCISLTVKEMTVYIKSLVFTRNLYHECLYFWDLSLTKNNEYYQFFNTRHHLQSCLMHTRNLMIYN